ncbi:hypothetical protein FXO37_30731 [Capsicum annuum]|nr:hypothetical protein FXO37_30731 [Capsicum annuum]
MFKLNLDLDSRIFFEEVIDFVELGPLRLTLVGLPGVNGLSTEQQKRLNIAVELVANPSIIFVDEPTSGLNARAAAIVMRTVRNTIDTGRTVVCTIHQPSINIFEAFDESMPGVSKVKDGYNPATWMLEVTTSAQEMMLGVDFADLYKQSDLYRRKKTLSVSYGVIVYAMIRFEWTASKFFWYLFIMYFTLLYFTFYGMMTVAVPQMKLFLKLPSTFSVAYGIFSQDSSFHDHDDETVEQLLRRFFGFKHEFLGVVAAVTVAYAVVFSFIFALGIENVMGSSDGNNLLQKCNAGVKSLSKSVALLTSYEFQLVDDDLNGYENDEDHLINMEDDSMHTKYISSDLQDAEEDCGTESQPRNSFTDEINFYRDQIFAGKKVHKMLLDGALMRQCFNYFTKKSCTKLLKVKCVSRGCSWLLRARKYESSNKFCLYKYVEFYTCGVEHATSR